MQKAFALNRSRARLMGVCAGIADKFGWDVTFVRVALVLLTFFALGPVAIMAYLIVGLVAQG
ncbi:MAG: PspC domain-containing protein [Sphingobium sp.]|nr:PspC domain-containing protein [Sphingobium sp.]